jgi:hypothetical protein
MHANLSVRDGILRFAPPRPRAGVDPARWLLVGWGADEAVSALTPLGGVLGVRPSPSGEDPSRISLPEAWFWISLPRRRAATGRLEVGLGKGGRSFLILKFRDVEMAHKAPLIPAQGVSEVVEAAVRRALNAVHQSQSPLRDLAALLSMSSLVRLDGGDRMALRCHVGQAVARVELPERRVGVGEALPLIPRGVRWLVPSENDFLVIVQADPLRPLTPMVVGWLDGWDGLGVIGMLEPRLWLEAVGGARWDSGD